MNYRLFFVAILSVFITFQSCKTKSEPQLANTTTEIRQWKPEDTRSITGVNEKRGLILNSEEATPGYVLFQPSSSTETFLINKKGEVVHKWTGELNCMQSYLQDNGNLIRLERDIDFPTFAAGGQAGRIREYDWDGNMLWDYEYATETELIHHDIEILPNGNVLAISYEVITPEDAAAAGRDTEHTAKAGIWPDKIIEIKPQRPEGGEVVWEWRMWDHIVQDRDSTKPNYGIVSEHPRKIDVNAGGGEAGQPMTEEQITQMKKMGFLTSNATADNQYSDITHVNAVAYNADLDQIAISSPHLHEIYIIDHSIGTEEARGEAGDLLYRWGNPQNYGRGTEEDQVLYGQHDIKWIPKGYPGAGNLMVFNNDIPEPGNKMPSVWAAIMQAQSPDPQVKIEDIGNYSAVHEFSPPMDNSGSYEIKENAPFGPEKTQWDYMAPDKYSFYSAFISGAQRLKNGNTLITSGAKGRFFEVTANKEIVWEYWNPYVHHYVLPDGSASQPTGPFIYGQFRATQFTPDFPAFQNKDLKPIQPQPETFEFKMPPPPEKAEVQ